jgi:DNA helicase-2/ATP-dependent DNA helicase PcrA
MTIDQYISSQLNEEQMQATTYTDSSSLIVAGAGSGKTRVLTYKIAYLIYHHNISPTNILAVTFTNKAANEMKERLIKISKELSQSLSDSPISTIQPYQFKRIGTFHSMFLKILKEDISWLDTKLTNSFGIYDEWETTTILRQILKDLHLVDIIELKEIKGRISKLKNEGILPARYRHLAQDDRDELIAKIYEKYQQALQSANSLDFDDLLLYPYILFQHKPEILAKWKLQFPYILVDEAQDTNYIQFELMKMLTGQDGNITFIGDDFQSIYRRRGALMENFLNLHKIRSDIKMFKLQTNYRSKPHIIQAGNHIIANNTRQYHKNIIPHRQWEEKILVVWHNNDQEEAINIVGLIKSLKNKKWWLWSDHTILYRTNAQSQPFEQVLVTEGIPYKIQWWYKFFERKEIKDILAYLKYILNPDDQVSLKRIINVPNRKIGTTTIAKLEDYASTHDMTLHQVLMSVSELPLGLGSASIKSIKDFAILIRSLHSHIDQLNPMTLIKRIVSDTRYETYLIHSEGKTEAEEKMQNIWQLINMASKYTSDLS